MTEYNFETDTTDNSFNVTEFLSSVLYIHAKQKEKEVLQWIQSMNMISETTNLEDSKLFPSSNLIQIKRVRSDLATQPLRISEFKVKK